MELRSIRLDKEFARLKAKYGDYDLLVYTDTTYLVRVNGMWYGLRFGNEKHYIPVFYDVPRRFLVRPFFESIKAEVEAREVRLDEAIFRKIVYLYTRNTLRSYRII